MDESAPAWQLTADESGCAGGRDADRAADRAADRDAHRRAAAVEAEAARAAAFAALRAEARRRGLPLYGAPGAAAVWAALAGPGAPAVGPGDSA